MTDNYYEILGIDESATTADIKKAYRELAKDRHPDKDTTPGASERFLKLKKAYEILSDIQKRKDFDRKSPDPVKTARGPDIRVSLKVPIRDMIRGLKKNVRVKRKVSCVSCAGTGSASRKTEKCIYCEGTGLQGLPLLMGQKKKCTYCGGHGKRVTGDKCPQCDGQSIILEVIQTEITLDPVTTQFVIHGKGNQDRKGGPPGNLIVDLEVEADEHYEVKNLIVSGRVGVSPAQAVLGTKILLNVFDREFYLDVPAGVAHGQIIEKIDGGISYEGKTGVFRAIIGIVIPVIITKRERELYQELLTQEKEDAWPKVLSF
jgi:molecular chaperone DnaJ